MNIEMNRHEYIQFVYTVMVFNIGITDITSFIIAVNIAPVRLGRRRRRRHLRGRGRRSTLHISG